MSVTVYRIFELAGRSLMGTAGRLILGATRMDLGSVVTPPCNANNTLSQVLLRDSISHYLFGQIV